MKSAGEIFLSGLRGANVFFFVAFRIVFSDLFFRVFQAAFRIDLKVFQGQFRFADMPPKKKRGLDWQPQGGEEQRWKRYWRIPGCLQPTLWPVLCFKVLQKSQIGKMSSSTLFQAKVRGQKINANFFCTKLFKNPSGHGCPRQKSWTSAPKSAFFCGPGDGEKLFDPGSSGRKGQECPREIRIKKFMFMLLFLPWKVSAEIRGEFFRKKSRVNFAGDFFLFVDFYGPFSLGKIIDFSVEILQRRGENIILDFRPPGSL